MKTPMKKILTALAVAIGLTTAASAATDELGLTPKHWYKFNGNLNSDGATALSIGGENGASYVDSFPNSQAYLFKSGYHPWGSGMERGSGDFTIVTVAKTANLDHGIIWSHGNAGTARGFALVAVGADKVALRKFGSTWGGEGDVFTVSVPDATARYHVYTLVYKNSGCKFSLYVDAASEPAGTGTVADSASGGFPNKDYQFGSRNQGVKESGMTQGYGCCLDEYRLYQQALTTEQIATICETFQEAVVYTGSIDSDTEWKDITWSETIEDPSKAAIELTVENNPTITMDDLYAYASVKIIGDATFVADDSIYEDGCWQKTILGGTFTATGTISFGEIIDGFTGAYAATANGITLRAQNKEVISINIAGGSKQGSTGEASPAANLVSGDDFYGIAPTLGDSWNNINWQWQNGGNQTITIDGPNAYDGTQVIKRETMSLSATGKNTWQAGISNPFLRGYLDDGNGVTVEVHGIPYTSYDVIVYATSDDATINLAPVTINGTQYTFADGVTKPGSTTWGQGLYATPEIGKNALRVNGCTGDTLTINAVRSGGRATLCAVQVINKGEVELKETFTATIPESVAFESITWDDSKTFEEGQLNEATITVDDFSTDEVEISFENPGMYLGKLEIISDRDVKLTADEPFSNVGQFIVTGCTAKVTYNYPVTALATSDRDVDYAAGTAGDAAVGIAHGAAGTTLNLIGGTYKISETHADVEVTYNVTDSTLNYPDCIGLGKGTYNFGGSSAINTPKFVLVQGGGNSDTFNLTDDAEVNVSGTTIDDSNQNSVMFGHWSGNSTFTISDYAAFTAAGTQILIGKTGGDHTINVNGGTITTKGIKVSGNATGTNTLNLKGGALTLGDIGITAYANTLKVNVTDNSTITASGTALPITQPIDVAADMTLTIDATGATVSLTGAVTGEGTILISGGNYDIGEARVSPTLPEQVTLGDDVVFAAKQTVVEYANGLASEFSGFAEGQTIVLNKLDGSTEELTADENGNAASEAEGVVHIDGPATYADATFTNATCIYKNYGYHGTLSYKSIDALGLQYDSAVTTNAAGTGAYLKHHPWITGMPDSFMESAGITIAVVGEMSVSNNTMFVHMGRTNGSNTGIFLATGSKEDEVVVKMNTGTELTEITTMTVPHAATARHVYIITKEDTETQSIFKVYLDGTPWKTVALGKTTFAEGVQCGSDHGGQLRNNHIVEAVTSDDTALINVLRVYDRVISEDEIEAYTAEYPYTPASGTSSRTCAETDESWVEDVEATCWSFKQSDESEVVLTNEPPASSAIVLDGTSDVTTTMTVNLEADAHHDSVTIASPGAFKFVKGENDAQIISGQTTIGCPVEIEYGSLDISGAPLTLIDEGAIVFDLSALDFSTYYADAEIPITGDVEQDDEKITATGLAEEVAGRTVEFRYNGTQYVVAVTVKGALTAALGAGTTAFSAVEWKMGDDTVTPDWTLVHAATLTAEEGAVLELDTVLPAAATLTASDDLSVFKSIDDAANVTLTPAEDVVISAYVAEGEATELPCTINGTLGKTGAGTLTLAIDRDVLVKEGTLKAASYSGAPTITVEGGAFDVNGKKDAAYNVVLAGGKLMNGSTDITTGSKQFTSISVTENSEIGGTGEFGYILQGWGANVLPLNGATLTKADANTFSLCNCTVTNGTLAVTGGTLGITANAVTFTDDANLTLGNGTTLAVSTTLTIGAIAATDATINNTGTISAFTLTGTINLANAGTFGTITLADNAVINAGNKRLTLAGAGTVNVTLTQEEYDGKLPITLFTPGEGATIAVGTVMYNDADITSKCTIEGNQITAIDKGPALPSWMEGKSQETINKYNTWAAAYEVAPADALQDAFLLNCANDADVVTEEKTEFVLNITVTDGVPVVTCPEGYNGVVTIYGATVISSDPADWHVQAEGDKFFKATLTMPN